MNFIIDSCLAINVFQYLSHTFSKVEENHTKEADGETDKTFWDMMLKADSKDYERICAEFGVGDLELILKKLEGKRGETVQNKRTVWQVSTLKVDALSPAKNDIFVISAETSGTDYPLWYNNFKPVQISRRTESEIFTP